MTKSRNAASARPHAHPTATLTTRATRTRPRRLFQWPLAAAAPTWAETPLMRKLAEDTRKETADPVAAKAACAGGPPPRTWPRAASSAVTTLGGTTRRGRERGEEASKFFFFFPFDLIHSRLLSSLVLRPLTTIENRGQHDFQDCRRCR